MQFVLTVESLPILEKKSIGKQHTFNVRYKETVLIFSPKK
jgi:hypothetical protein